MPQGEGSLIKRAAAPHVSIGERSNLLTAFLCDPAGTNRTNPDAAAGEDPAEAGAIFAEPHVRMAQLASPAAISDALIRQHPTCLPPQPPAPRTALAVFLAGKPIRILDKEWRVR